MHILRYFLVALAWQFALTASSHAGAKPEEAKALVDKAIAHIQQVGAKQAFRDFNQSTGPWIKGELYLIANDFDGKNLVQGSNPGLVGKNLWHLKSPDGKFVLRESVELARTKGSGWLDYQWHNPLTGRIESKTAYVVRIPGMDAFISCGVYKN